MEAMDNPSYFTLPASGAASLRAAGGRFLRIMGATHSSASSTTSSGGAASGTRVHSAPATPTAEAAAPLRSPSAGPTSRRSFRFLVPSSLGGAARGTRADIRQLVMGHPRLPVDAEPVAADEPPRARRSSRDSDFADDMVYYNLPAPPRPEGARGAAGPGAEAAIPCGADETDGAGAQYYNLCAGRRRHSIGTFVVREGRAARGGAGREEPRGSGTWGARRKGEGAVGASSRAWGSREVRDGSHEWRHHARKRCHRCSSKASGRGAAEMDDILIISSGQSKVAELWVNYLRSCFDQISKQRSCPPFRMLTVCLEDFRTSIPIAMEEKMAGVRLQIVIICPLFLDYLFQHPEPVSAIGRLLCPERVIAMLLGVEESSITEEHRAALISYNQWKHLQVKNKDTKFVTDFLNLAMGILSRMVTLPTNRMEKASFSVMPKKVKEGHNKVIVLLTEPLEKEDELSINIDKAGEIIEVPALKRRNLYTVTFAMPASCLEISMLVGVHVIKNGKALGCRQVKCESRMRELDQILRSLDNPLEFMCQTLGFSPGDRDQLDSFLLSAFQRNIPPHFNLLNPAPAALHQRPYSRSEEYPTLLHFAARFGLEKLSWQLLECPGGEHACDLRNVCELTPAEMAEKAGHTKLANSLKGYLQMSEFSSMYSYLKMVCQNQNSTPENLCEADYHKPRPLSETYQVPPSARPLTILGAQSPVLPLNLNTVYNGYLEMHPAGNGHTQTVETQDSEHQYLSFVEEASHEEELLQRLKKSATKKSQDQLDNVQDQLAEIINDFKNNVFTIAEAEKLVENWRNRNDVQQSFKEKQEQLDKMRSDYEMLQKKIKEDMKRPTPFDRIIHFFKGKGKDGKETVSSKSIQNSSKGQHSDAVHQRPSSSLSLQSATSSSSSEQMSVASVCSGASLGDSGTHSDPEDKKASQNGPSQNGNLTSGNDFPAISQVLKPMKAKTIRSYETPPAPRPIHLNLFPQSPKNGSLSSESRENRPPCPAPRPFPPECTTPNSVDEDSYYITPDQESHHFGENPMDVARCFNIDLSRKKSPTAQQIFPGTLGIKDEAEDAFDQKSNKPPCDSDQHSPKVPSSPAFSTTSENEFPNYANITSASIPLLQGDVLFPSSSVPPPVPPRLEQA
ncbi:uncharacterized protein LOC124171042 isoform X2 [Ischnura elegans]|uniref:uncharacterized protein LOC124171042 isoform X2 n=1 Tax=Ischnura elegans TaxID=197161 RepID=UPI001ED8A2ED|nr:uncharacterized protein LOC124171042 isoform X2 [Ischnura elegans]